MITWGDVTRWDGAAVGLAGEQLAADLAVLERAADDLRDRSVPGSFLGAASLVARLRQRSLTATMDAHVEGARGYVRAMYAAEGSVTAIAELVVQVLHDASGQEFSIGADGSVTDVSAPRTFDTPRQADAWSEQRVVLRDALVARVEEVLTAAVEVDSALEAARPDDAFADAGPQGVIDPGVAREWASMTDAERRAVLEEMARRLAEDYGLDDVDVVFEDLEDKDGDGVDDNPATDSRGSWSQGDRTLRLDVNDLDDPDLIDTVAHEVRHAMQHEVADDATPGPIDRALIGLGIKDDPWDPPPGVTRKDAETWDRNFDDYQRPEDDFQAYLDQPVEVDAREAGADYLDDLTLDELRELQKASR